MNAGNISIAKIYYLLFFFILARSRVINGIRTSPVVIEKQAPSGAKHWLALSGIIFPITTSVLYIIPYIMNPETSGRKRLCASARRLEVKAVRR